MAYYDDDRRRGRGRDRYEDPRGGGNVYLDINHEDRGYRRERSRSGSQAPPQVNVYNIDVEDRHHDAAPRRFDAYRDRDFLADELRDLALERRERSRSRGRIAYEEYMLNERLREAERREDRLRDEEMHKLERARLEDEVRAKVLKAELRARKEKEEEEDRERRWEAEYELRARAKKDKEKEEERRMRDQLAREAAEKKEKEERMWRELEARKKAEEDKKEAELLEAQRILKERADKEKREKEEQEAKFQDEMRARMRAAGFSERYIDDIVDKDRAKRAAEERDRYALAPVPSRPTVVVAGAGATLPKIRREYIEITTLEHYGLPWKVDPSDPTYIIILQQMDKHGTDMLFEHTRRIREGMLLVEVGRAPSKKKKEKEYAWVRHRSKSRSGRERVDIEVLR